MNLIVTSAAAANATSTTIVGAANPQVVRGYTFTATVRSSNRNPSGNVVFRDGDSDLATVALDNRFSATCHSTSLGPGVHYISAAYPGAAGLAGSVSTVLPENIPEEAPDFSMTLSPAAPLVLSGASVSSQVRVQPVNGFNQDIRLTCSTGTAKLNCGLQSASLPNGTGTTMLTITRASTSTSAPPVARTWVRMAAVLTLPLLLALPFRRRKRAGILVVVALLGASLSCGIPTKPATTNSYTVMVTGVSQQTNGVILHTVSVKVEAPSR